MNTEMLTSLLNKVIKVDRGGPESKVGLLLAVGTDFLALLTKEDGVVYYQLQHIKSITVNTRKGLKFDLEVPDNFEFVTGTDFLTVLQNLQHEWVKINRGGPESFEGVLEEVWPTFVTVIKHEEIVRLSIFHLRSISYGLKVEPVKEEEREEPREEKQNEQPNA